MIEYILLPKDDEKHLMHHQIRPEVGRMDSYLETYGEYKEIHYEDKDLKQSRSHYDVRLRTARSTLHTQDGEQEKAISTTKKFHTYYFNLGITKVF